MHFLSEEMTTKEIKNWWTKNVSIYFYALLVYTFAFWLIEMNKYFNLVILIDDKMFYSGIVYTAPL